MLKLMAKLQVSQEQNVCSSIMSQEVEELCFAKQEALNCKHTSSVNSMIMWQTLLKIVSSWQDMLDLKEKRSKDLWQKLNKLNWLK